MISRSFAKVNKLKTYTECTSCSKGHPPCRYTKTGKCVHCHRDKAKRNQMSKSLKSILRHKYGLVPMRDYVHLEDVAVFKAFCKTLRMDRGIPSDLDSI